MAAYRSRRQRKMGAALEGDGGARPASLMPPVSEQPSKRDGRVERKSGGWVAGEKARQHLAKRARGGGFSSARRTDGPEGSEPRVMKRGGGIHIKPSHEGLLHEKMGIAKGKPISTSALKKAEKGADPTEKKEIVFAENARKWHHGG